MDPGLGTVLGNFHNTEDRPSLMNMAREIWPEWFIHTDKKVAARGGYYQANFLFSVPGKTPGLVENERDNASNVCAWCTNNKCQLRTTGRWYIKTFLLDVLDGLALPWSLPRTVAPLLLHPSPTVMAEDSSVQISSGTRGTLVAADASNTTSPQARANSTANSNQESTTQVMSGTN